MDIVVSPTRSYIKYALVVMASVYANHPTDLEINFWFLQSDFTDEDKKYISDYAAQNGQKAFFADVDNELFVSKFTGKIQMGRWPLCLLYPLLVHVYLPREISRCLYLDIDIAVTGNLLDLYNLDFSGRTIIASKAANNYKNYPEPQDKFEKFEFYDDVDIAKAEKGHIFCAGVILYNLDKMRRDGIDLDFYISSVLDWNKLELVDQGILNVALSNSAKILTTCKYNYRLSYRTIDYFNRDNLHYYDKKKYEVVNINDVRIIHYSGFIPAMTKPWDFYFEPNDISSYETSFLGLFPECVTHFNIWWDYAKLTPEYDNMLQTALMNKAAYKTIKKIMIDTNLEFCNQVGLESLLVPSWRNVNSIIKNDDLNKFTKPRVYRCLDGNIKNTLKNLPEEFTEERGFRLTVKHISSNAGDEYTSVLQILEPNSPNASVYRRYCGRPKLGNWGKWYKLATTEDIKLLQNNVSNDDIQALEERIRLLEINQQSEAKPSTDLQAELTEVRINLAKSDTELNHKIKQLEKSEEELTNSQQELYKTQAALAKKNDDYIRLQNEVSSLKISASYRIGRFITFIPRKICGLFKKK